MMPHAHQLPFMLGSETSAHTLTSGAKKKKKSAQEKFFSEIRHKDAVFASKHRQHAAETLQPLKQHVTIKSR